MKFLCKALLLVLCLMISAPAWTQMDLIKKARQKTEKKSEEEIDKKLDEGIDKLFGKKKDATQDGTGDKATVQPAGMETEATEATGEAPAENPTGV